MALSPSAGRGLGTQPAGFSAGCRALGLKQKTYAACYGNTVHPYYMASLATAQPFAAPCRCTLLLLSAVPARSQIISLLIVGNMVHV